MFSLLYQISFILSLSGLIAWFYFQEKPKMSRLMSTLFLGGFLGYLLSLGMVEATIKHKCFVLFRDLMVMGVISQFFNLLRNNSILFFAFLAGFYGLFATQGIQILEQTFLNPTATEQATNTAEELLEKKERLLRGIQSTNHPNILLDRTGELLIEINEQYKIADISTTLEAYQLKVHPAFHPIDESSTTLDEYYVIDVPNEQINDLEEIKKALYKTTMVNWVEENELIQVSPLETTPLASTKRQYGLNDPYISQLWGFEVMNVDELNNGLAKSKIKPKKKALIAILDTGVDATHEDLAANYVSTKKKYDTDDRGHGTHCAGIAAAVSNNAVGIASMSPNNQFVEVTSIQVLTGFGFGSQKQIIDGMILAADKGADVISMSLGGLANSLRQKAYEDAVKYCNKKGSVIVVAAGNSSKDARNYTPANLDGVITVSAIDSKLDKAIFSNHVTHLKMGVAAPGVAIYSTFPNNEYKTFNGTSMATPYVAGLVGILKSIQPDLTTKQVYAILNESGKNTNATKETGKLIQPAKAIQLVID